MKTYALDQYRVRATGDIPTLETILNFITGKKQSDVPQRCKECGMMNSENCNTCLTL